jgi:type II secretory pathway predicted ATPase ExeA
LLTVLGQAAPESHHAERAARRETHSVGERLDELLGALHGTRVVLAIDDAHLLLDANKDIARSPLRQFVEDLLDRRGPCPVQLLLVTSVSPDALLRRHARERHVSVAIQEGLDQSSPGNS